MNWVGILTIMLLVPLGFSAIIESGDNGVQFANETSAAKCLDENVDAVYICFGNNVKVVSSVEGEGSTFYKPEGKIVECPDVAPTDMGAECIQMLQPNYCPNESVCGESPQQVFPGQNNSLEPVPVVDEPAVEPEVQPVPEPVDNRPARPEPVRNPPNREVIPAAVENDYDTAFIDLIWIIVVLGLASLAVLFFAFKKSLTEG